MNKIIEVAISAGALLFIGACSAVAQTAIPSPYTDTSSWTDISAYLASTHSPAMQGSNTATITQNGSGNQATLDVTVPSSIGAGSFFNNQTTQTQTGDSNTSILNAMGNSNVLQSSQTGNNNTSSITAYGNNNSFSNTQTGNNLSYTLQRVGNGASISVTQKN